MGKTRVAIVDGIRTPMCKAGGILRDTKADDLGTYALKELLNRTSIEPNLIQEVIFGNVAMPGDATNIARVIALKSGLPLSVSAYTVQRNCASGMQAISSAASKIKAGEADIIVAGGCESMSNIPLLFNKRMTSFFENMMKSKTIPAKLSTLLSFRPSFLKPVIGVLQGLTDPVCGKLMGDTAETLANDYHITRKDQD